MIGAWGNMVVVEACLSEVDTLCGSGRFLCARCEHRCWCVYRELGGLRDGGDGSAGVEVSIPI